MNALNLGEESAAVGALTWWNAGYTGGRGLADIPANFSVEQDPVMRSHPAFQGITFETPPGAVQPSNPSITQHGTALLSMAVAQGPTACGICQPADQYERGVAPGTSKVLDPTGAGAESDWAAGVPYYWFDAPAHRWRLQAPAPDPAQVINYSRGSDADYDDSLVAQTVDATVESYGVTMTIAAGNSGPASRTVNDPAIAFNALAVGAFTGGGTVDPTDDRIFGWSSRGPTAGGRKKPDLVAVGDGGLADSYYQSTGKLWKYDTGTSYAAPQVGGGALLLAGAGIRDPKVVKSILINSARPGRATPGDSMGTQTGWLPDWGWGELNLDAAYRERLNFARGQAPANGARFFRATVQAPGDRATLVWHRRVADCQPLRQGCYYDTNSGFRVYTLSNLDLAQYDAATGAQLASSTSAVDNVEQVRAASPGAVVYKVSAGQVDGPTGEPFSIAGTRPLTPLKTPQPTVTLSIDADEPKHPGDPVRVDATTANRSPDLGADDTALTLELPAGVELVSGQQTHVLGSLQPQGQPGDSATVSWTVRGTTHGLKQLTATATATKFGSTFGASSKDSFSVDAEPPQVRIRASLDEANVIHVSWDAQDDSSVASFDVATSVNGASHAPWFTHTTQTAAELPAAPGARYRFRIRATDTLGNSSPFLDSEEVTPTGQGGTEVAPPTDPGPSHPANTRQSPELAITRTRTRGQRLLLSGTVAIGASGRITGTWKGNVRARGSRTARATTYAHLRKFRLSFALPRRARRKGRVTVTYVGDRHFRRQVRHGST
jgi:hypothetical protein